MPFTGEFHNAVTHALTQKESLNTVSTEKRTRIPWEV